MSDSSKKPPKGAPEDLDRMDKATARRAILKKLGRFATVTTPTVTLLLAAQSKPAHAAPSITCCAIKP